MCIEAMHIKVWTHAIRIECALKRFDGLVWTGLYMHIYSILLYLWEVSVDSMEKCLGEITRKKGRDFTYLYYRLFMALCLLRDFFYCGGKGMAKEQLDSKKFNVSVYGDHF